MALLRMKREELVRQEFGPALIAANIWNALHLPKKFIDPIDFMPSMLGESRERRQKTQQMGNVEEMMQKAKAITLAMGGTVGPQGS